MSDLLLLFGSLKNKRGAKAVASIRQNLGCPTVPTTGGYSLRQIPHLPQQPVPRERGDEEDEQRGVVPKVGELHAGELLLRDVDVAEPAPRFVERVVFPARLLGDVLERSEERRVGKECA